MTENATSLADRLRSTDYKGEYIQYETRKWKYAAACMAELQKDYGFLSDEFIKRFDEHRWKHELFCGYRIDIIQTKGQKGEPIGVIVTHTSESVKAKGCTEIFGLYVIPEERNKGHGTRVIKWMQKHNRCLCIWCYDKNEEAKRLYERLGFVPTDETYNGPRNGNETARLYIYRGLVW